MPDINDDLIPEVEYFVHRTCTPEWKIDEKIIQYIDLTYLVSGSAIYFVDGNEYVVKAGDILCISSGSRRSAVTSADELMECYSVNFQLVNSRGMPTNLPFPVVSHIDIQPELISSYTELSMEWIVKKAGYRMKIRSIFLSILFQLFNTIIYKNDMARIDYRVKKVMIFVAGHYQEPLSLLQMAKMINLHPVYFGVLFKETTGMTFREYITEVRLNHAEDLLWTGIYSVYSVSFMCGFSDVFYFSKVFKAKRGISPSKIGKNNEANFIIE